ncbi:MAG: hypothetical protein KBC47_03745 [Candidatus Peribacteraceae bacterium]|nr:hypothetical protein [Candidatus Peribacteraceae bacterium]
MRASRKKAATKKVETAADETMERIAEIVPGFETQAINVSADTELPFVAAPISNADLEAMNTNEEILVSAQPFPSPVTPSSEPAMASHSPEHDPAETETPAPAAETTEHIPVNSAETVEQDPLETPAPTTGEASADAPEPPPPAIERPDQAEWRTIEGSQYFSASLKQQASELAAFDESHLISNMSVLSDHDHAAMQTVLTEFRWCQHLIAELESDPNEVTYGNFMTGMTALFQAVHEYTGTSTETQTVSLGSAAAANTDTGIEKSAIGLRMKFLIAQLKEMTQPVTLRPEFMRTTLAQRSAHRLFGMERQQEVTGYLKQAEKVYGSEGLKYSGKAKELAVNAGRKIISPIATINALAGNIRRETLRLMVGGVLIAAEITGLGYAAYKTVGAGWNYARHGGATAPQDPSQNLALSPAQIKQMEAQDQAAVQTIFEGMDVEVKGKNLHIRFGNTGALTVNETLFVLMGTGTSAKAQHVNPIGNSEYTIQLSPAQLAKGTEIAVTIRGKSRVGSENFLLPNATGDTDYKTVEVR